MTGVIETQQPQRSAQPISSPTKPQQYRAIGLVMGKYQPGAEEITQGTLIASDGTPIDAVVKGKLLSLVKNKLDLTQNHLWVVYPKTPKEESDIPLHVQLVGIWEPQTLHPDTAISQEDLDYKADEFSIQGEVVFQDFQNGAIVVKIVQAPKKEGEAPKYSKIKLLGYLPPKSAKNFWEFRVRRVGSDLTIQTAENIASLAPARKPFNKQSFNKKPFNKDRGYRPQSADRPKPPAREGSLPKPLPKKRMPPTDAPPQ